MPQLTLKHATIETIFSAWEALVYRLPGGMALCERLPHFYQTFGVSQAALAASAEGRKGVSREALRRWEAGQGDVSRDGCKKLECAAKQALMKQGAGELATLAARWLSRGDPPKKKAPVAPEGTTEAVASEDSLQVPTDPAPRIIRDEALSRTLIEGVVRVRAVQVIAKNGLTDGSRMLAHGQIVTDPSPRLLELAETGELLLGERVACFHQGGVKW